VIKVLLMLATLEDRKFQPVLVSLRGDQELNEIKLLNALSHSMGKQVINLTTINPEQVKAQGLAAWPFGAIGPDLKDELLRDAKSWAKKFLRFVDPTATALKTFVCGANQKDMHRVGVSWSEIESSPTEINLRRANAGEKCLHDPSQILQGHRGIEVGHIFQLGRKYSKALGAQFTNDAGEQKPFWMGCYGIGISRLAQAAVEQHHDEAGIIWPLSIAPFEVLVVIANLKDPDQLQLGEIIYKELKANGIEALLDDRDERAGVKFKDADLIGIPWRIVSGRDASSGQVELLRRSKKELQVVPKAKALAEVIENIHSIRS